MTKHVGRCQCGEVSFAVEGSPNATTNCHCRMCQKSSGAPYVTWVELSAQQVQWTGREPTWYASSPQAERGFCSTCGSPMAFRYAPGEDVDLPSVMFDRPEDFTPDDEIWTDSRQSWTVLNAHLEHHPKDRGY